MYVVPSLIQRSLLVTLNPKKNWNQDIKVAGLSSENQNIFTADKTTRESLLISRVFCAID